MEEKTLSGYFQKIIDIGMHDAVVNGELIRDIPSRMIFVADSTERDALTGVQPGQFAATYGCASVWQYTPDGTWEDVL